MATTPDAGVHWRKLLVERLRRPLPGAVKYSAFAAILLVLASCASASSNLTRLQAECSVAPAASLGASLIPAPGVGAGVSLALGVICANPQIIANDEAAIAAALQTLLAKKSGG